MTPEERAVFDAACVMARAYEGHVVPKGAPVNVLVEAYNDLRRSTTFPAPPTNHVVLQNRNGAISVHMDNPQGLNVYHNERLLRVTYTPC